MHYHLELIMPPTDNVEKALAEILGPWSENYEDEEEGANKHGFYDFYEIGGRYSGRKLEALLGDEKLKEFKQALIEKKVTVSGLQFGKETIAPASQIPMVDQMWNEFFPDSPVKVCPLFDHYKENWGDIMKVSEIPKDLTAFRVIIAAPKYEDDPTFDIKYMISQDIWNGVKHLDVNWDTKVETALADYKKDIGRGVESYIERCGVKDDWLCVTLDYHT